MITDLDVESDGANQTADSVKSNREYHFLQFRQRDGDMVKPLCQSAAVIRSCEKSLVVRTMQENVPLLSSRYR